MDRGVAHRTSAGSPARARMLVRALARNVAARLVLALALLICGCAVDAGSALRVEFEPKVRGDELVLELDARQRSQVSSTFYTVVMRSGADYYAALEGMPTQMDDDGVVRVPADPMVLVAVADDWRDAMLLPASCTYGDDGSLRCASEALRLCGTTRLGAMGIIDGYEDVELEATFDAEAVARMRDGQPVEASDYTLTRTDPAYPLGPEVLDSELLRKEASDGFGLYAGVASVWNDGRAKTRAEDGTIASIVRWEQTESLALIRMDYNERLGFALVPASVMGEDFLVQVLLTDTASNWHASDLVALDRSEEAAADDGTASGPLSLLRPREVQVATDLGTMTFELASDHAVLADYAGEDLRLEVPSEVEGLPVTEIGDEALYGNEYVREVSLPATVATIGAHAFCGSAMRSFAVPAGLRSIGPGAFANTRRLMRFVQDDADAGADADADPGADASAGADTAEDADAVAGADGGGDDALTCVVDGVLFSADAKTLLAYPNAKGTTYEVPEGVEVIGHAAFAGSRLTQVTLPSTLRSIGSYAFADCSSLESLELPEALECIGSGAFAHGVLMTPGSVVWPQVDSVHLGPSVRYVGHDAFGGLPISAIEVDDRNATYRGKDGFLLSTDGTLIMAPTRLRGTVVVPEGVTALASGSLANVLRGIRDKELDRADVFVPRSVTSVADDALPRVYATDEETLESVGRYAVALHVPEGSWAETFAQEQEIAYDYAAEVADTRSTSVTLEVPKARLGFEVYADHATLVSLVAEDAGHVEVPATVEGVPVTCVGSDDGDETTGVVKTIVLPHTLTQIAGNLLHSISGLRRVQMEDNDSFVVRDGGLYTADGQTLVAVPSDYGKTFSVAPGTHEIGERAFYNATVEVVELSDGLERIGTQAFARCSNLTTMELPRSVRRLDDYAFDGSGLQRIVLNEGLQHIGTQALSTYGDGIPATSLPDSVTSVADYAFGFGAPDLFELQWLTDAADDAGSSDGVSGDADSGLVFRIGAGLHTVGQGAFKGVPARRFEVAAGNKDLRAEGPLLLSADGRTLHACASAVTGEVRVPEGVEYLAKDCFAGASAVTDVCLPESVLRISPFAFPYDAPTLHCAENSEAELVARILGLPLA